MGATHFLTKTMKHVSTEMSLHIFAYNLKRMIQIFGMQPLLGVIGTGWDRPQVNCPTARAKLMATMPSPAEALIGEMNSPLTCRPPMVIMTIRVAASTTNQGMRC